MNETDISNFSAADPSTFLSWGFPGLAAFVGLIVLFWQFKLYTGLVRDAEPARMREARPMLLTMIIGSLVIAGGAFLVAADKGFAAKECARITIDPATTVQSGEGSPLKPVEIRINDAPPPAANRHINLKATSDGAQQVDINIEPYVLSRLAEAAKAIPVVQAPTTATGIDEP